MNEAMREMLNSEMDRAWEPQPPSGMSPLGQSADRDWSHLNWYENGALAEAAMKEFPPVKTSRTRPTKYLTPAQPQDEMLFV